MADFNSNQAAIAAARTALDQAQLAALQATARAQQAQSALDQATRQQNANQQGDDGTLAKLQAAAKQAAAQRDAAKAGLQQARASLASATAVFGDFSDPRQTIGLLSDSFPILLFPVRIETRFRTIAGQQVPGIAVPPQRHQLWVRIYPDDCSVDTFEPMFSQAELTNVKNYWLNVWRAGGVENDQRGAWSNLVAAHGSGRAGWLVDNFQPTPATPPTKVDPSDEILVIGTNTPLSAAEASAISTYWQAVWLADNDSTKLKAAQTAMEAAVGAARAAQLVSDYVPFDLADKPATPPKKTDVRLSTAFVIFPPDPDTTQHSWSQAPQIRQFPDRFVVLGYSGTALTLQAIGNPVTLPLYAGPDPSGDPNETIRPDPAPDGPDLFVPDELKWMVDFDRAVAAGMGITVDLTPDQAANGLDLLLVIGLQLSVTAESGPAKLQELLSHHQSGRSGFELLPQGTTAHNSSGSGSGYTRNDNADASFDDRKNRPLFTTVSDPTQKRDGQWFSEFLGLDPAFVAGVSGSGEIDQMQARAMQTAMWPATFGYWMNTLFTPSGANTSIFSDDTIDQTRAFFTQFVSGRGSVPAIRIGSQPYGILPTTAFSRIQWYTPPIVLEVALQQNFLANLLGILRQIDTDWENMAASAHWIGEGGDPHQTLLNVLAHHPSSVEYFSRTGESLALLYNTVAFWGLSIRWRQQLIQQENNLQTQAINLLRRMGYNGADLPDLLNHFFLKDNPQIATIIDDRPLSETQQIREYTDTHENYIQWMIEAAASLETLRAETGFTNNQTPQALLYLYLRHALMLAYYSSSYNYHRSTGILTAPQLLAMRTEAPFIHVAETAPASESRFAALYKTESRITGSPTQLVSDFIGTKLGLAPETADLTDQVNALKILATASTAQLERLFAEHIDTCSYRYDSWLLGFVNQHMASQRAANAGGDGQQGTNGLYLGAYAWVGPLKPSSTTLTPAQIPADLAAQFPGTAPLMVDPNGGGYVHAPSISHADAAAVLRSGYLANASQGNPDTLAVNLSSDRVRLAMTLIEGIRNGQSLGALLGYQFERGLHDDYTLAEVDQFIYPLRKAFPLVADSLASTATGPNVPIEAIEARNVMDGKKLVDHVQSTGNKIYPYGLSGLQAVTSQAEQEALNGRTNALLDAYDAIADLALAEGVYQAVQGNYDRVASTISAYTTGNFPPEPQVVQTPPTGVNLTHRFAVQFKPGLPAPPGATPRAQAEPAVDEWLGRSLVALNQIACTVTWSDPITRTPQNPIVTLADLKLRPLDVLYLLKPDNQQAMAELDDRILRHVIATSNPRPDANLQIQYLDSGAAAFSMFETGPLLRELRTLVTQSRPLQATDVRRPNDASQDDNSQVFADATRIANPLADLKSLGSQIDTFVSGLNTLLSDTVANRNAIINGVDNSLATAVTLLEQATRFAMPSSGWGFAYSWLNSSFTDLMLQVSALVTRWNQKLTDFQNAITAYNGLPLGTSDADRFKALRAAELLVSSQLDPLRATPALELAAATAKGNAFQLRLNDFAGVLTNPGTAFVPLFNLVGGLSTAEFDSQPFDISSFGDRAIVVTQDIARILSGQSSAIATKVQNVQTQLDNAAAAGSDNAQAQAVQAAAKQLLGDDFQIIPEFTLSTAQAGEWANAMAASTGGQLLNYLKTTAQIDFPVDEWLYGVARVRPAVHSWEVTWMFDSAFGITSQTLTPIQLPFATNDSWLALAYPPDYIIDSDRLLYTCAYSVNFDPNARQCGLLLDEWTEVIPGTQRDTAITFNHRRPDSEPPQSMLLVSSPSVTGNWQWDDLVRALIETLALAKKRAVEPVFLDPTVYSRFLPATVMASTTYAITIATALTAANGAFQMLQVNKNA